ncbi:hypothetical protein Ancab_008212, partial [Ancistrocladus abbreviatus]
MNANLSADFTQSNWSSPLEELHFYSCNFTGRLPHSIGRSNSMRIVDLADNSFTGFIPQWIWNTTEFIDLGSNYFTGELPSSVNGSMISNLQVLLLHDNMLNGSIPSWLFALPSIVALELSGNQFTGQISAEILSNSLWEIDLSYNNLGGTVDLDMFSKLKNLWLLSLSGNNLSVLTYPTKSNWSNLAHLELSSCNLSEFPDFLRESSQMSELDLSNNQIHGKIPVWMQNLGLEGDGLFLANLSNNSITGGLENLPWEGIGILNLRFNRLSGEIPLSICSSNQLWSKIPLDETKKEAYPKTQRKKAQLRIAK